MRVVLFGTYDTRRHPRVATLREGLEAAGDEVIECNEPLGLDTAARVRLLQRPWLVPGLVLHLVRAWSRLWRAARRLGPPDAVVVGYLGHFDVHLARRIWPDSCLALDHLISASDTAVDRRVGGRLLLRLLAGIDRAAVEAADVPFVDTRAHLSLLPVGARDGAAVVPVGAPGDWFGPPRRIPGDRVRVVFFGMYTPLQGAPTIGRALALLAGDGRLEVTMIGHGQDLEATRQAARGSSRVTWLRWVRSERLPEVVSGHHICLGVFGTSEKAGRVVPNKVFQGAAAGCAVVTSDTVPQREALGPAGVFVPPGDPEALAAALRDLAGEPGRLDRLRAAAARRAARCFRPGQVVRPLREAILAQTGGKGGGSPDVVGSDPPFPG